MRERCLQNGFDNFATHELLEMLLYYSIPRIDTNGVAHGLLERFGSLKGICEASFDELLLCDGIGPQSAILLKLIPELMKRYAMEEVAPTEVYDTLKKLSDFFYRKFIGLDHECLYMMLLNNRLNMIDCVLVSEGVVNSSTVPVRLMTQKALFRKASTVVLAHNHPQGLALPSQNDLAMTETLVSAFDAIGVTLTEHLILAGDRCYPIMQQHFGSIRLHPATKQIDSGFYRNFYDIDYKDWRAPQLFPKTK
ncbi:MAG TPA: hypothetical protein DDW30_08805 [Clostridiales bacterium]|nr:hypothetical protein [Clostridiales bacterium]